MAFPATHVRFAMDLESYLPIQDQQTYYAGALYPDSRYFTEVKREATHGLACPHDLFAAELSDFQRGWATHLLYDEAVGSELQAIIPETYPRTRVDSGMDDWWVYLTAVKAIEDLQNCAEDVRRTIQSASSTQNPCGEEVAQLEAYYALVGGLYTDVPTWERLDWYMQHLHVPPHRISQLVETGLLLSQDNHLVAMIAEMYPRQLAKTIEGRK